jgi:hypothetical protein
MSISSFNEILRKFIVKFRLVQIFTQKMFRNVNFNLNFIKKRSFRKHNCNYASGNFNVLSAGKRFRNAALRKEEEWRLNRYTCV